ncbi:MAG TPA: D-Ala-D-Ala carboxypeptidase family metallohydrolase [Candidatus Paceibacterota bacterium]
MDRLSEHLTLAEATKSQQAVRLGISNNPNKKQLEAMILIAIKVFEPIRKHFNTVIGVSSFFRGEILNTLIGGSNTSQHCKGEAMDIDADIFGKLTNKQIFDFAKLNLSFDQLIWEYGNDSQPDWVHISYSENGNRKQILRAYRIDGRIVYKQIH